MTFKELLGQINSLGEYKNEGFVLALELLGTSKAQLLAFPERKIEKATAKAFLKKLGSLKNGEPMQYLLGYWEFAGRRFEVGRGVLIPREDTLAVVELAKELLKDKKDATFADLGSGSGCIAVTLALETGTQGIAVEKSKRAFSYLAKNIAQANGAVTAVNEDMFKADLIKKLPPLDLVVSNPPYITGKEMLTLSKEVLSEPHSALYGGDDGLEFYRKISKKYYDKIKKGGALAFEVGYSQADAVIEIMENAGFEFVAEKKDFSGHRRAVAAIKK